MIRTMTAIAAVAIAGVTVAACGSSGTPAGTVQGCTAGMKQQIVLSESRHLVNPNWPLPAACAGLTTAELKLSAADAVIAEMP